jgi:hypothetical protein
MNDFGVCTTDDILVCVKLLPVSLKTNQGLLGLSKQRNLHEYKIYFFTVYNFPSTKGTLMNKKNREDCDFDNRSHVPNSGGYA